ncbi:MAG: hypothetical protein WC533_04325 [Candidatus Pacearchaeota archaeon]
MVNKKGEGGGPGIGTLIGIGVVVIAAVLVIFSLVSGFSPLQWLAGWFSGQTIEAVSESCVLAVNQNRPGVWCRFVEVDLDGEKQWVNCDSNAIKPFILERLEGSIVDCATYVGAMDAKGKCLQLAEGKTGRALETAKDTKVNGVKCAGFLNCGNNVKDAGEECDGTDLGGKTCQSLSNGLSVLGNDLKCNSDCNGFDTVGCQYAT